MYYHVMLQSSMQLLSCDREALLLLRLQLLYSESEVGSRRRAIRLVVIILRNLESVFCCDLINRFALVTVGYCDLLTTIRISTICFEQEYATNVARLCYIVQSSLTFRLPPFDSLGV